MGDLSFQLKLQMRSAKLDIAARVEQGVPLAIVGPSGAGKSTLLRALAGLAAVDSGFIRVGEETCFDSAKGLNAPAEERGFALVFQELFLFPHLTVRQNISFAQSARTQRRRASVMPGERRVVSDLMARMQISHLADARPSSISGGERQRVAIARALASSPRLLMLDEPLSALDVALRSDVIADLAHVLRTCGAPSIVVTHSFAEAALLADIIMVIVDGSVVQVGDAASIVAHPQHEFVAELSGMNVLRGEAKLVQDRSMAKVEMALPGGHQYIWSTDEVGGSVNVLVAPSDITLERTGPGYDGASESGASSLNHIPATIRGSVPIANRVRVQLDPPLTAEITADSWRRMNLKPGQKVVASFKATNVRLIAAGAE